MSRVRSKLIRSAVASLIAVGASLTLARVHPFGDAGLYATKDAETPIMEHSRVPLEVRAILAAKCADCHSAQTRSPIYGRFAPGSWLMERDIVEARGAMNLSLWDTYSPDQQQTFAAKIAQQTKAREMPPVQYRMIHWDARKRCRDPGHWPTGLTHRQALLLVSRMSKLEMAIRSGARSSSRNAVLDAIR